MNKQLVKRWIESKPFSEAQLDNLMADAKTLSSEMIVYRGCSWSADLSTLSDRVFATSLSRDMAESFLRYEIDADFKLIGKTGDLLIMSVYPGVKVLVIPGIQDEILIQRGTTIVETSRRVISGINVIDVDIRTEA